MKVLIVLCFLVVFGENYGVNGDCGDQNKALDKDGKTCYECGRSTLTTDTEISTSGKQDASPGNFPWHAALFTNRNNEGWTITCGGTLISPRAVLVAAHCVVTPSQRPPFVDVFNPQDIRIALGKITASWNQTDPSELRLQVNEIRVHPDFKGRTTNYADDIALLILESEVKYNNNVMPACLYYTLKQLPPKQNSIIGYFSGFGHKEECIFHPLSCTPSNVLQYLKARQISFDECYEEVQTKHHSTFVSLTADKLCIGDGSAAPVQKGDAGGGFTVIYQGLHYVTGIASVKLVRLQGQNISYSYGTLTNVARYMDWIKENLSTDK